MKTPIIIDANVMMSLSDENQEKVVCIYHLASMLEHHHAAPFTEKDFDELYDSPLHILEKHCDKWAERFNLPTPDIRIRPNVTCNYKRPQQRQYPEDAD